MFVVTSRNEELCQEINLQRRNCKYHTFQKYVILKRYTWYTIKCSLYLINFEINTELSISHYFLHNISQIISFSYNINWIAKKKLYVINYSYVIALTPFVVWAYRQKRKGPRLINFLNNTVIFFFINWKSFLGIQKYL